MTKFNSIICPLLLVILLFSCESEQTVSTGLDNISNYQHLFRGKRIGIITNHTAYNKEGKHITDIFYAMDDVDIQALFGPEHGIHGKEAGGKIIKNKVDKIKKIPVYSLYAEHKKPSAEMLNNIDVLIFDLQDVGARFYTYIYTMSLAMEAAAEQQITFIVLDRPNPINGIDVEGNILELLFASFVGLYPIPARPGMTIGELARMFNEEGWLKNNVHTNLHIIPLKNWKRYMWYDQTGLSWHPPSPNIPNLDAAIVYPGICLLEGTNISEGRGTYQPFLHVGAPWFSESHLSMINKIIDLPGVRFRPITFVPSSIPGMAPQPKHLGEKLVGVSVSVTDRNNFNPYLTGIALTKFFYETDKEQFKWFEKHFDRLCGTNKIREFIIQGKDINEIREWIKKDLNSFLEVRKKYLLY